MTARLSLLASLALLAAGARADAPIATGALVSRAEAALAELGTYRARMTKEERLADGWSGPQVTELVVREHPFAVRAQVLSGPGAGRRFLYDRTRDRARLLNREGGLLGVASLWIEIDSRLTREDTRHPVTELGYGFVLKTLRRDDESGLVREDEGPDRAGARCFLFRARADGPGTYAGRTRMCFDDATGLPTLVESWDRRGLFERLRFVLLERDVDERFDPDTI